MIDALDIPEGTEDENRKLRKIINSLMKQVERTMDVQGGAFSLFQTATLLDDKVRERTAELATALNSLEQMNHELEKTKSEAETARVRLVEAVESISEGFALYDSQDRLVLCNSKFWDFWGPHKDGIPYGTHFDDIARYFVDRYVVPDDNVTDSVDWLKERLNRHRHPKDSFVIQLKDGRWLKINERQTRDGGIVGIYTDITDIKEQEQRRREQELAEQNILLQTTLDTLRQGVSVFDRNLQLVAWNERFVELLQLPPGLVQHGMSYATFVEYNMSQRGLNQPEHEGIQLQMDHAKRMETQFYEYTRPDGCTIEVHRNPMEGGGFVTTYTDITSRRQAAEQLREAKEYLEVRVRERTDELHIAKEAAEEANLSKTRFIAAASHDLLQPLNAARLFISTLMERRLAEANYKLVERADYALKGVESLLGALLEISKLDAGAVPVVIEDHGLSGFFNRLTEEFGPIAAKKGLTLKVVKSSKYITSDNKLLMRILRNFVSNAIRYTERGRVLVGADQRGDRLRLCVYDTGPGISEQEQAQVFEEFRQLGHATAQEEKGAGLGLAIVKRIANTLGHEIRVHSQLGRGTCFSVEVPIAVGKRDTKPEVKPTFTAGYPTGLSVLVVDNEKDIQQGMMGLLENWSCLIQTAGSLDETVAKLDQSTLMPDAIIADYHLDNGETGIDLVCSLYEKYNLDCPAMILSADRSDELKAAAAQHGFALLNKPVKPARLLAWLTYVANQ